jgi:peptide deformylase
MDKNGSLQIVDPKNEILNSKIESFDFNNPLVDPEELAVQLVTKMRDENAIGLASNQLGLSYRVFAMEGEPAFVCFNPKVVLPGTELVVLEEACLTFPGLYVKVKRPRDIKVRFQGPDGEVYTRTFTGMSARIFQHELDHLDGITMLKRANGIHRAQALKNWKLSKRKKSKR